MCPNKNISLQIENCQKDQGLLENTNARIMFFLCGIRSPANFGRSGMACSMEPARTPTAQREDTHGPRLCRPRNPLLVHPSPSPPTPSPKPRVIPHPHLTETTDTSVCDILTAHISFSNQLGSD